MTLLEADINMVWKASSVNTGVDDYAAIIFWSTDNCSSIGRILVSLDNESSNTFCISSSGFGCSARIAANNFGYNVQVGGCIFPVDKYYHPSRWGGASSHLINAIIPLFIFKRATTYVRWMEPLRIALKTRMEIYIFWVAHFPTPEISIKMNQIYTKLKYKTTKDQFDIGIAYILIDG